MKPRALLLLFLIALFPLYSQGEENCAVSISSPEAGSSELVLGDLGAKLEQNNKWLKMKISGAFETLEWTWVSFAKGPAKITGVAAGKGREGILGEAIAVPVKNGVNWGIFKSDDPFVTPNRGRAYFVINNQLSCTGTTLSEWNQTVEKVFGSKFVEQTTVKGVQAEQAYSGLGLK